MAYTVSWREIKLAPGGQPVLQAVPIPCFPPTLALSDKWFCYTSFSIVSGGGDPPEAVSGYLHASHLVGLYLWFTCEWQRAS